MISYNLTFSWSSGSKTSLCIRIKSQLAEPCAQPPPPQFLILGEAWKFAFLTHSQVMPMQLILGPHLENHHPTGKANHSSCLYLPPGCLFLSLSSFCTHHPNPSISYDLLIYFHHTWNTLGTVIIHVPISWQSWCPTQVTSLLSSLSLLSQYCNDDSTHCSYLLFILMLPFDCFQSFLLK